jgi:acetylornithine deacetylase/succinyl-diaminopimelate desuccinylase-like protein
MPAPDFRRLAEQHQDEIVALARDLVRIDTTNTGVMPTGGETAAAALLQARLGAAGIGAEIHGRVPERGNLFAALEGGSGHTCLVLASHTDVVPAGDEAQWTHPPFAGTVEGGYLHGRGAADMKGTVAAQAMALILLRRLNVPLAHSVGFVCVADEEAGGAYGMGWVAGAHPDRLQARYCVNEGGGYFVTLHRSSWCLLGVGEKGRFEVHATFHGRGAHAARPWQGDNALFRAARALERLKTYEPERDVSSPIFPHLRRVLGPITPANLDDVIERLSQASPRLADHCRQVSRMLVTPTLIAGGVKSNSVPDACRLTCDVRALPHQGPGFIEERIRALLSDADVQIDCTAVSNASPASPEWVALLSEVLGGVVGQPLEVVPSLSGGFTDSRFVRELGIAAYGFAPGHPESDPSRHHAHGPNESFAIVDLVVQTAAYLGLAYRLATT